MVGTRALKVDLTGFFGIEAVGVEAHAPVSTLAAGLVLDTANGRPFFWRFEIGEESLCVTGLPDTGLTDAEGFGG